MIRDLYLPKQYAELLVSRLIEKNLQSHGTSVTYYRSREASFRKYFVSKCQLVYCKDVKELLLEMSVTYMPSDWRLFIDSSTGSLKRVLLHNGNVYGSISIGHSVELKQNHCSVKPVFDSLQYEDYNSNICVDLKMVNFLLGQQSGYTEYPCFLCYWDSRAKQKHWCTASWPDRTSLSCGDRNAINDPLVDRNNILLPPFHIELGIMMQFVKALDHDSDCFKYISAAFPGLSELKKEVEIFDGPQIRELVKDPQFISSMSAEESRTWKAFKDVCKNFLGNNKSANRKIIAEELMSVMKDLGCNMTINFHYLHSHLDWFPENLGDVSEEQGERFYQDIKVMEERYQGRWDGNMMADYCWSPKWDRPDLVHARKSL